MKSLHHILRSGPFPGNYDGTKYDFSPQRLEAWARKANSMLIDGFMIPAPPTHDEKAVPAKAGTLLSGEDNGFDNLGWWTEFRTEQKYCPETGKNETYLYGVLDAPDDGKSKDDEGFSNTPAGKVRNIKRVSVRSYDKLIDADGKEWEDVIVHVAPVIHPGFQNQEPLQEVALSAADSSKHPGLAFSVDYAETSPGTPPNSEGDDKDGDDDGDGEDSSPMSGSIEHEIVKSTKMLREMGVFLDPCETAEKFVRRLNIALTQAIGGDMTPESGEDSGKNDTIQRGESMSGTNNQPDSSANVDPPASATPTTPTEGVSLSQDKIDGIALSVAKTSRAPMLRDELTKRAEALVEDCGLDAKVVETEIKPLIDSITGVALSATRNDKGEFDFAKTEAELVVETYEKALRGVALSTSKLGGSKNDDDSIGNPTANPLPENEEEAFKAMEERMRAAFG